MDLIYLAFANDSVGGLEALKREREAIVTTLLPKRDSGQLIVHVEENATSAIIARDLFKYRKRIIAFHYSGHADPDFLHFGEELARADGMASLLGKCPNLKLVVLNGCSTREQVKLLVAKGVKVVISTSAPVEDTKAANFGIKLWNALAAGEEIESAFNSELGEVELSEALNQRIKIFRATVDEDEDDDEEKEEFWGLYGKSEDVSWALPSRGTTSKSGSNFKPNTHLVDKLWKSLVPYDTEIRELEELYDDEGVKTEHNDKHKKILSLFPIIISENLRKLAAKPDPFSKAVFYNEPGIERLKVIRAFHVTLMEMLCFILLARLWNEKMMNSGLVISSEEGELLEDFIYSSQKSRETYDFIQLISGVFKIFKRENVKLDFLEEVKKLEGHLQLESPLVNACIFFRTCSQLCLNETDSASAEDLSQEAEVHLAEVLKHLCFTVLYDFVSVRGIKVVKHRHKPKASFQYTGSKLYGARNNTGLETLNKVKEGITDTASILLTRKNDVEKFINLTPFIIDANVFKEDAPLSKFYFFQKYLFDVEEYSYRFIFKPEDDALNTGAEGDVNLKILKKQFESFRDLLITPTKVSN